MSKKASEVDEMIALGLEEHYAGEVLQPLPAKHRAYALLYIPEGDRIVLGKLRNGMPCLFGGARDLTGYEKDEETVRRELFEETGGCVKFTPGSLHPLHTSRDGLRRFYWSQDVTANVKSFQPNSEIARIGYARVKLGLVPQAGTRTTLARAMLKAWETPESQHASFLRMDTPTAIHKWVTKVYPNL